MLVTKIKLQITVDGVKSRGFGPSEVLYKSVFRVRDYTYWVFKKSIVPNTQQADLQIVWVKKEYIGHCSVLYKTSRNEATTDWGRVTCEGRVTNLGLEIWEARCQVVFCLSHFLPDWDLLCVCQKFNA